MTEPVKARSRYENYQSIQGTLAKFFLLYQCIFILQQ